MRHDFADGKYTVISNDGYLFALRNGEPWKRELLGDQLVYAMLAEVDQLKQERDEAMHTVRVAEAVALGNGKLIDKLEMENKKLRDALSELNNWLVCGCGYTEGDMSGSFQRMQKVTARALKGEVK